MINLADSLGSNLGRDAKMVAITVNAITIEMKYVINNNGSLYYQRAVPTALQERLRKKTIKAKLDPMLGNISLQAQKLAKQHDALFKAMHGDKELTVSESKLVAIEHLAKYGLKPDDANTDAEVEDPLFEGAKPHLDAFMDDYLERYRDGVTTKEEDLAYKMLFKPLPMTLGEALDVYFEEHERGREQKWRKKIEHYWALLVEHCGDVALQAVTRNVIKSYILKRLDQGKKTGTIEKELAISGAIFNAARRAKSINCINPFERQKIPGKGLDVKEKIVLTKAQLGDVVRAAIAAGDDIRAIVVLQAATGARISEIVGLRATDVGVIDGVPFLDIKTYGNGAAHRRLKTKNSVRKTALLPFAAKVAQMLAKDATGTYLFPRYITEDGSVNNDAADGAVNKWLKAQVDDLTSHCFRHTVKTMLRQVTSKSINDQITGHSGQDDADEYGEGAALKLQLRELKKAFKGVDV